MRILESIISVSLIMSPVILILLLLTPLLDKKFSARGRYWVWLVTAISLLSPFAFFMPEPAVRIALPVRISSNPFSTTSSVMSYSIPVTETVNNYEMIQTAYDSATESAAIARENAIRDAERIRETTLRNAETARENALREAEIARENAVRDAEAAREDALRAAEIAKENAIRDAEYLRDATLNDITLKLEGFNNAIEVEESYDLYTDDYSVQFENIMQDTEVYINETISDYENALQEANNSFESIINDSYIYETYTEAANSAYASVVEDAYRDFDYAAGSFDMPVYQAGTATAVTQGAYSGLRLFTIPVEIIILLILALGIFASLVYEAVSYRLLCKDINRWSAPVLDENILGLFRNELSAKGIGLNRVELMYSKKATSPMLMGLLHPKLLIPYQKYELRDLPVIFKHELTHYQHHDIWFKLLLAVVKSVHWFNPLVHLMASQADKDIEYICDSVVVRDFDMESRADYSEIIMITATQSQSKASALTTQFVGGKKALKKRFDNILFQRTKANGFIAFSMIGILVLSTNVLAGFRFIDTEPSAPEQELYTTNITEDPSWFSGNGTYADFKSAETDFIAAADLQQALAESVTVAATTTPFLKESFSETITTQPVLRESVSESANTFQTLKENSTDAKNDKIFMDEDSLKKLLYPEAKKITQQYDKADTIILDLIAENIKITKGGSKISIKYYEWSENQYALTYSDNKGKKELKLERVEDNIIMLTKAGSGIQPWQEALLKSMNRQIDPENPANSAVTVEIQIPESANIEVIKTENVSGMLTLTGIKANSAELETVSGKTSVDGSSVKNVNIDSVSGSIVITNSNIDSLDISTVSGAPNVSGCEFNDLAIDTVSGTAEVSLKNKVQNYNVKLSSMSGSLMLNGEYTDKLSNAAAKAKIRFDSVSGSLKLSDLNAGK